MKKVVIFGIFDGVHDGHRDLFRQAKELGDELIVIVGRDSVAEQLKGKKPKYTEQERIGLLKKEELVSDVVLGDEQISTYKVLEVMQPNAVCLGYDQQALEADLRNWVGERNIDICRAKPHMEHTLHNSFLR